VIIKEKGESSSQCVDSQHKAPQVILTFPHVSYNFHTFTSTIRYPLHLLYLYPQEVDFDDLPTGILCEEDCIYI
jgi:hypothetical protein